MTTNHRLINSASAGISRRAVMSAGTAVAAAALAPSISFGDQPTREPEMPNSDERSIRKLGSLEVTAIGLGCMTMTSATYNPPRSKEEMIPVIRKAVDIGVTLFDTAEIYGPFTDEELVGEALAPIRKTVAIATKFGFHIENGQWSIDKRNSRPEQIRRAVEGSLKRLRTDRIDLLYQHRVDPNVPIEDVAGTVKELIKEGKVLNFGLSEASPATISRAHKVQPVAAVQTQYSLVERNPEHGVLDTCEKLGIGFVAWGPTARGFLADCFNEWSRFAKEDRRTSVSFFEPEAIAKNMALLNLLRSWADRKGVSPVQFALGWLLAQKPFIVPIPGTTKVHHLVENIGAMHVEISDAELAAFNKGLSGIEVHGIRKPESVNQDQ